jgi:hypothetical protein
MERRVAFGDALGSLRLSLRKRNACKVGDRPDGSKRHDAESEVATAGVGALGLERIRPTSRTTRTLPSSCRIGT